MYRGLITPGFVKCHVLTILVLAWVIIGWEPQGKVGQETSVMDHVLVRDGLEAGGGKEGHAKELVSYKLRLSQYIGMNSSHGRFRFVNMRRMVFKGWGWTINTKKIQF